MKSKCFFPSNLLSCWMRYSIPAICTLLLVTACGNPKQSNKEEQEEVSGEEVVALTAAAQTLLNTIQGEYFMLTEEGNEILFLESCSYTTPDIRIGENTEESGSWEISWLDDPVRITDASDDNGDIIITTDTDEIFVFYANENNLLWNFGSGGKEVPPIVKVEALSQFKIRPCTDAAEIMKSMPANWYELTSMDDRQVIYVECESAPGGYDIGEEGKTIDFRSGSDPNTIVSMSKANNVITIQHRSAFNDTATPGTIKVNLESRKHYVQFDGRDHVSAEIQDYFDTVEEDCG